MVNYLLIKLIYSKALQANLDITLEDTPLEENRLPQINIGSDHQADIPELCNDRIDLHRAPEQLLWDPGINDALDDNEGIYSCHFIIFKSCVY